MNKLGSITKKIRSLTESEEKPVLIAIDGRSGAGKSTLAKKLKEKVGGVIVVGDDFYSGGSDEEWNKLAPKEKVDKCIDWKRLRKEVLKPLLLGESTSWYPFNFETPGLLCLKPTVKTVILALTRLRKLQYLDFCDRFWQNGTNVSKRKRAS